MLNTHVIEVQYVHNIQAWEVWERSDFGIGPWKKAAMDFLDTFVESYSLVEQRIGNPGSVDPATNERYTSGAVVRILRSWPGKYQVTALRSISSLMLWCA
jgi:hypothetical protein